jgi:tRNA 2-thiouridine synthesizing protein A
MDDADVTEVDALGLLCPLPVLRARKRLQPLPPGARLALLADDPAAVVDVPHFCAEQGHALESEAALPGGGRRFVIRKGGA